MKCNQTMSTKCFHEGKHSPVGKMKMDDVEFTLKSQYRGERDQIEHLSIGPDPRRLKSWRHNVRAASRVAAGEKRDLMSFVHQCLGQVGNDTLHAAIAPRRDRNIGRADLGNFHRRTTM